MKKLTKFITTAIISLSLIFGGVTGIQGNTKDVVIDYLIIKEFMADEKRSNKFLWDDSYNPNMGLTTRTLANKENTTSHDHFEWTWINHFVHWTYNSPDFDNAMVTYVAKDYATFISPDSRGFVLMKVIDFDRDGISDYAERRWIPVMQNDTVMMPDYPKGFVNLDWYQPTQEEAEEFIKREMAYWVKVSAKEA